jgi:hypothetical protein
MGNLYLCANSSEYRDNFNKRNRNLLKRRQNELLVGANYRLLPDANVQDCDSVQGLPNRPQLHLPILPLRQEKAE